MSNDDVLAALRSTAFGACTCRYFPGLATALGSASLWASVLPVIALELSVVQGALSCGFPLNPNKERAPWLGKIGLVAGKVTAFPNLP